MASYADRVRFPPTRPSAFQAVRTGDQHARERAMETLVAAFGPPVRNHLRIVWNASDEEARELAHAFFAHVAEKRVLDGYDPRRARFRTFLRTCLDRFASSQRKARSGTNRGGAAVERAGGRESAAGPDLGDPEAAFEREWRRGVFAGAVEGLRRTCEQAGRTMRFRIFERYDLEPVGDSERPTYGHLATELGVSTTKITNELASARRELRRILLELMRDTTGSEEEYREEVRALIGQVGP